MLKSDTLRIELRNLLNPIITESTFSISKKFAKIVTSKSNQHVTCMTVGPTGSSKSTSNMALGVSTALEIAKIKGGNWTDYFNLDFIAIISKDRIFEVLKIEKKYCIKQLDDIGVAWNARRWKDEFNMVMNDISQTMRTDNEVVLLTLPDTFLIDKVPRSLVHYFIEMSKNTQENYDRNIAEGKFFQVIRKPKENETWFKYESLDGKRYHRVLFSTPPSVIRTPYEIQRTAAAKALKLQRLEDQENADKEASNKKNIPQVTIKERVLELDRDVAAGIYKSLKVACKENNINFSYAKNVVSNFG